VFYRIFKAVLVMLIVVTFGLLLGVNGAGEASNTAALPGSLPFQAV
jgi:hypothetical protein